jgi:hypothetical protein
MKNMSRWNKEKDCKKEESQQKESEQGKRAVDR